jgi:methionyl-tRNA synthetase
VDPAVVVTQFLKGQPHAADVYRYFLLREVPFGQDGSFSEDALLTRLNADLANDLGNLVNRTCAMIDRYGQGKIPARAPVGCAVEDAPLQQAAVSLPRALEQAMSRLEFSAALEAVMSVATRANQYIETAAPWKLAKQPDGTPRLHAVLRVLAEVIRILSIVSEPFMPSVSAAIWAQLGCGNRPRRLADAAVWQGLLDGQPLGPHPVLFPRSPAPNPQPGAHFK